MELGGAAVQPLHPLLANRRSSDHDITWGDGRIFRTLAEKHRPRTGSTRHRLACDCRSTAPDAVCVFSVRSVSGGILVDVRAAAGGGVFCGGGLCGAAEADLKVGTTYSFFVTFYFLLSLLHESPNSSADVEPRAGNEFRER